METYKWIFQKQYIRGKDEKLGAGRPKKQKNGTKIGSRRNKYLYTGTSWIRVAVKDSPARVQWTRRSRVRRAGLRVYRGLFGVRGIKAENPSAGITTLFAERALSRVFAEGDLMCPDRANSSSARVYYVRTHRCDIHIRVNGNSNFRGWSAPTVVWSEKTTETPLRFVGSLIEIVYVAVRKIASKIDKMIRLIFNTFLRVDFTRPLRFQVTFC